MEATRPRNSVVALGLVMAVLFVGQSTCRSIFPAQRTSDFDPSPRGGDSEVLPPSILNSTVIPESQNPQFGEYDDYGSIEFVPTEGQLCPEGYQLVEDECKLVLA